MPYSDDFSKTRKERIKSYELKEEEIRQQLRDGKAEIRIQGYDDKTHSFRDAVLSRHEAKTELDRLDREIEKAKGIPWYAKESVWADLSDQPAAAIIRKILAAITRTFVSAVEYLNPEYRAGIRLGIFEQQQDILNRMREGMDGAEQDMEVRQQEAAKEEDIEKNHAENGEHEQDYGMRRHEENLQTAYEAMSVRDKTILLDSIEDQLENGAAMLSISIPAPADGKMKESTIPKKDAIAYAELLRAEIYQADPKWCDEHDASDDQKRRFYHALRELYPDPKDKIKAYLNISHLYTYEKERGQATQYDAFPENPSGLSGFVIFNRDEADALIKEADETLSFMKPRFPEEYGAAEEEVKREELTSQMSKEYTDWLKKNVYPEKQNEKSVPDWELKKAGDPERLSDEQIRAAVSRAIERKTTEQEKASAVTIAVYSMIARDPSSVQRIAGAVKGTEMENIRAVSRDGRELPYSAIESALFRTGNLIARNPEVIQYLPAKEEKAKFYGLIVEQAEGHGRYTKPLDEIMKSAREQAEKGSGSAAMFLKGMNAYLEKTRAEQVHAEKQTAEQPEPEKEQTEKNSEYTQQPEQGEAQTTESAQQEQQQEEEYEDEQEVEIVPPTADVLAAAFTDNVFLQTALISYMGKGNMPESDLRDDARNEALSGLVLSAKEDGTLDTLLNSVKNAIPAGNRNEQALYEQVKAFAAVLDPDYADMQMTPEQIITADRCYDMGPKRTVCDSPEARRMYAILESKEGALFIGSDDRRTKEAVEAALGDQTLEEFAARDSGEILRDAQIYGGLTLDDIANDKDLAIDKQTGETALAADLMRGDGDQFMKDLDTYKQNSGSRNDIAIGKGIAGVLQTNAGPGDMCLVEQTIDGLSAAGASGRMLSAIASEYDKLTEEQQMAGIEDGPQPLEADYGYETYANENINYSDLDQEDRG